MSAGIEQLAGEVVDRRRDRSVAIGELMMAAKERGLHLVRATAADAIDRACTTTAKRRHNDKRAPDPFDPPTIPQKNGVRLVRAADIKPRAVRWLWESRLPMGSLSLLVGVPGQGKSTLALLLAARLTRGALSGDLMGTPADVIIASAEDSREHTLIPRLIAAGADLERVHFVTVMREGAEIGLQLPNDVSELAGMVKSSGAKLVMIDPIMAHLAGSIDSHRDHSVRCALAPLHRMAELTDCAILPIGHLNKAPTADLFRAVGGSIGLTGAARSVMLMTPDPEAGDDQAARVLSHGKSNLSAPAPALRLRVVGATLQTPDGNIATARVELGEEAPHLRVADVLASGNAEERSARQEAEQWLREFLTDGPKPTDEVLKAAQTQGIRERTLRRAKKECGVVSQRAGFGAGSVVTWVLP